MLKFVLLLSTTVLFTACPSKKDKGEEKPVYYLNQMMKDYVIFPEGSWWVYEDSATGNMDTVTVTRSKNELVDREDLSYIYDHQSIRYYSSFHNVEIIAGSKATNETYSEIHPVANLGTIIFHSNDSDSILLFSGHLVRERVSNISILDSTYSNVVKFTTTRFQHNLVPEFTFYAPHVGLIRKQLFNGTIWNLKEYHINN